MSELVLEELADKYDPPEIVAWSEPSVSDELARESDRVPSTVVGQSGDGEDVLIVYVSSSSLVIQRYPGLIT